MIFCSAYDEVVKYLRDNGVKNEILAFPIYNFCFPYTPSQCIGKSAEWIGSHEKELSRIYDLSDTMTAKLFSIAIKQRKMTSFRFIAAEEMFGCHYRDYFYDESIVPRQDVTLVDGGAFTGDSIEAIHKIFGNHIKRIYAFEPYKESFDRLRENLNKMGLLQISHCFQAGMGAQKGTRMIQRSCEGDTSFHFVENGEETVPLLRIDDAIGEIDGKLIIKMDIEGSEVAALRGAKNTIAVHKPYLAICVYHKMEDILDVPKAIMDACPNYKFYLRGGTHLECYGVPMN